MSKTSNYGLYLTDNSSEKFLDWREKMSGSNNSNMIKIDAALGGKAEKSVTIQSSLLASDWINVDTYFIQELSIEDISKDTNGIIDVSQNATVEQMDSAQNAKLSIIAQGDGYLTIAANGELPIVDIPVTIILLG